MERYMYRVPEWNGEFRKVETRWEEYQNQVKQFVFHEQQRSFDSVVLLDQQRSLRVLLPIGGGQCFFQQTSDSAWKPLYLVDRIEPNFTSNQLQILLQDCQTARSLLDNVLSRLAENILVPTSRLLDMRQKVKNVFHINVLDPEVSEVATEAFHFSALLSNFQTLRSKGFDENPTFKFEPDYTGHYGAFVEGVDDPTIHISPNHFYMDRENGSITLIHERAHTVLRLNGHPGGIHILQNPSDGVPTMKNSEALQNAYCYEWLVLALKS